MSDERFVSANQGQTQTGGKIQLPAGLEAGIGFGVASLTLGFLSIGLSILVIGAGAGLIGLILAIVHLARRLPFNGLAISGLVLSIIGTLAGAGFGVIYGIGMYRSYKTTTEQLGDLQYEHYYGKPSPDMTLKTIDGNEIKLSDLKGKRVMLDFWATWCGPCKQEIPHLIKLRETTSENELVIIGISSESADTIRKFAQQKKINYPLVSMGYDANLPGPFGMVTSIPTVFVIDTNGVLENALIGYHSIEDLKEQALGPTGKGLTSKSEGY